jgi:hypothetical protein
MPPTHTIAILGASPQRNRFSNKAVRAYIQAGWRVLPIHPTQTVIEELIAFKTLQDAGVHRIDRVAVYLSAAIGVQALDQLEGLEIGEVWLNPGTVSEEVLAKAANLGLTVVQDCAILALGVSPSQFPDQ